MSQKTTKIKWEDADFKWDLAPTDTSDIRYTWDDVTLVDELTGGDTTLSGVRKKIDKLEPSKKKRLVHLIMRKQGIKVYDSSKFVNDDIKIKITDVEMIIKEVRAQIRAENIHV